MTDHATVTSISAEALVTEWLQDEDAVVTSVSADVLVLSPLRIWMRLPDGAVPSAYARVTDDTTIYKVRVP